MREENKDTLLRFRDANYVMGAVNATGVANSIAAHGAAMLKAGWGTDQINSDPAIRIIVMGLSQICGATIDRDQYLREYKELGALRGELEAKGHKFD